MTFVSRRQWSKRTERLEKLFISTCCSRHRTVWFTCSSHQPSLLPLIKVLTGKLLSTWYLSRCRSVIKKKNPARWDEKCFITAAVPIAVVFSHKRGWQINNFFIFLFFKFCHLGSSSVGGGGLHEVFWLVAIISTPNVNPRVVLHDSNWTLNNSTLADRYGNRRKLVCIGWRSLVPSLRECNGWQAGTHLQHLKGVLPPRKFPCSSFFQNHISTISRQPPHRGVRPNPCTSARSPLNIC